MTGGLIIGLGFGAVFLLSLAAILYAKISTTLRVFEDDPHQIAHGDCPTLPRGLQNIPLHPAPSASNGE